MKAFKVLNNQSGMMAMMGAMIFTIAITTTLSTFYVYTLNQAKYHARIKEAYQLINIMESFATATRKAYDMGMSAHAKTQACPNGLSPSLINGTTDKYYCPPLASDPQTCFTREDTNEQYCTTISFATASVEIKKQHSVAEVKTNSFLKKWRKGLNDFYISPGIKDRVVDTSTMAYVMKKPMLLDWLVSSAQAQQESGGGKSASPSPTPINSDGYAAGYINCEKRTICSNAETVQVQPGGMPLPSSCPTTMSLAEVARYCNDCREGHSTFCPKAGGGSDSRQGGIQVIRKGQEEPSYLPVSQTFSIVM